MPSFLLASSAAPTSRLHSGALRWSPAHRLGNPWHSYPAQRNPKDLINSSTISPIHLHPENTHQPLSDVKFERMDDKKPLLSAVRDGGESRDPKRRVLRRKVGGLIVVVVTLCFVIWNLGMVMGVGESRKNEIIWKVTSNSWQWSEVKSPRMSLCATQLTNI